MERKKKEKLNWILPCIVKEMPVPNVPLIYTDENEFGMAGYNSDKMSKVIQSPYTSVQKSELYAILMVLLDFLEIFKYNY